MPQEMAKNIYRPAISKQPLCQAIKKNLNIAASKSYLIRSKHLEFHFRFELIKR